MQDREDGSHDRGNCPIIELLQQISLQIGWGRYFFEVGLKLLGKVGDCASVRGACRPWTRRSGTRVR